MPESALFVRKSPLDHKRNFLVSYGLTRGKNFLRNFYFWSKHNALSIRCGHCATDCIDLKRIF
jgi:hypothetical protein